MPGSNIWKDPFVDSLFDAILSLENKEECFRFFEDLATIGEIKSLAQRWEVAKMLAQDETYSKIVEVTGASTATISRVKRCLFYGADGYKLALEKMESKEKDG